MVLFILKSFLLLLSSTSISQSFLSPFLSTFFEFINCWKLRTTSDLSALILFKPFQHDPSSSHCTLWDFLDNCLSQSDFTFYFLDLRLMCLLVFVRVNQIVLPGANGDYSEWRPASWGHPFNAESHFAGRHGSPRCGRDGTPSKAPATGILPGRCPTS